MFILGIETSTRAESVAVVSDKKILAEIFFETKLTHSEMLLPHIERILEETETAEKIDAVAVNIGPGSFTGLRIGLATAKAFAYARQIKIVGVPGLQVAAKNFPGESITVFAMFDAQKNSAYVQRFRNCRAESEIEIKKIDEILTSAGEIPGEVFLCGDVLHKIKTELPANVKPAPANLQMPRASCVALCGKDLIDAGKFGDAMTMEPLYLRRSEAEELWEKRQKLLSEK